MSYEDTSCPCGGRKERQTMICQPCRDHLAGCIELAAMDDERIPVQARRSAAIRVLKLARGRNQKLALRYQF
jgi:hypothetical protein